VVPNRIKFFLAGPVLEAANPRIPGRPHQRLATVLIVDIDAPAKAVTT
jgi:hypothetical protein